MSAQPAMTATTMTATAHRYAALLAVMVALIGGLTTAVIWEIADHVGMDPPLIAGAAQTALIVVVLAPDPDRSAQWAAIADTDTDTDTNCDAETDTDADCDAETDEVLRPSGLPASTWPTLTPP
ncbi:MAG: hypothetical protein AAFV53_39700 [Myxococcota bacterium]